MLNFYAFVRFHSYFCGMITIEDKITSALTEQGAILIRFVDVSTLSIEQNRNLPNAIFFGLPLTSFYLNKVMEAVDYVPTLIAQNKVESDDFHLTELKAGRLADEIAEMLVADGYRAYSQSDDNLIASGAWDAEKSISPLPHKTIAVMAGVGWIGKNNLLVTKEYGSALCIGTILTDAMFNVMQPQVTESKCGGCTKCVSVCQMNALLGCNWGKNSSREDIVDIRKCTTCMLCLLHCPYTRKYVTRAEYE